MNSLYPHKEGDLTITEAQAPYYRCYKCDKVLKEEKDRHFDGNGVVFCKQCKEV